jgi:hypothetical protein
MAVSAKVYGKYPLSATNWSADTIKVRLVPSSYTPDQDAHQFLSSAPTGVGTDQTLGGKTQAYDGSTNKIAFDADDSVWTSLTGTFRYALIYKDTGTAATSPLIAYVDFGLDTTASAQDLTVQWNAGGIVESQAA